MRFSRYGFLLMLFLVTGGLLSHWVGPAAGQAEPAEEPPPLPSVGEVLEEYSPDDYARDMAAADLLTTRIPIEEVLGPLAPLALSPFFALLLLSGASMAVTSGVLPDNQLLMSHPVLSNQVVFWSLVVLTVMTSVPRFMKVSKIFAQTADFLETHAGIITYLLVLAVAAQHHFLPGEPGQAPQEVIVTAGIYEISLEALLMLACALNIFVINSIRFFFELLVLVSPIPVIDAAFETLNKSLTALLALLYAFSPWSAAIISLVIFALCLIAYRYVHHSVQYYRAMLTMPVLVGIARAISKSYRGPHTPRVAVHAAERYGLDKAVGGLWVYPDRKLQEIPKRAKCLFVSDGTTALLLRYRLLRPAVVLKFASAKYPVKLRPGALASGFQVENPEGRPLVRLNFSRAWNPKLAQLARQFGARLNEGELQALFRNAREMIVNGLQQLGQGISRPGRANAMESPEIPGGR